MSRKKVSTTIYIEPEQNDALKELAEKTRVPAAVYVRMGIDMVLNKYRESREAGAVGVPPEKKVDQ